MNAGSRLRIALAGSVVLGAALYLAAALSTGSTQTWDSLRRISPLDWGVLLGLSLVNYGLRYFRWEAVVRRLSGVRIGHALHACYYIAGFAFTTTPGKAGEALRSVFLRAHGISYGASLSTLLLERMLDLLAVALLSAAALASFPGHAWIVVLAIVTSALFLASLSTGMARTCTRAWPSTWPGSATAKRLAGLCGELADAMTLPMLLGCGGVGIVAWAAEAWGLHYLLIVLGYPLPLLTACGIYALATLAGALSFVPGGLGAADAAMVFCLFQLGCPLPVALAATLACRLATLWFAIGLGAAAGLVLAALRPAGQALREESTT